MAFTTAIRARYRANPHGKFGLLLQEALVSAAPPPGMGMPIRPMTEVPVPEWMKGWYPRNQVGRPTCVAHAAAACIEVLGRAEGSLPARLSARFLHQRIHATRKGRVESTCAVDADRPDAKLCEALDVLQTAGICTEQMWSESSWDPAELPNKDAKEAALTARAALAEYEDYGPGDTQPLDATPRRGQAAPALPKRPGLAGRIHAHLLDRRPVCIAMPGWRPTAVRGQDLFEAPMSWLMPETLRTGILPDRPKNEDIETELLVDGGHVVCAIGFHPAKGDEEVQRTGGGWFIFRNSWGTDFGTRIPDGGSPEGKGLPPLPGPGWGAVTARTVEETCWEWLALKLA